MDSVPPIISTSKNVPSITRFAVVILTLTAAVGAVMVYFFNPSNYGFYPVCQFHRLTGLNCPGCGATRALYALLHGNIALALHDNALMVVGMALVAGRGGWFWLNHRRGRPNGQFFPAAYLWPVLVVIGVFSVLRNLPAFAFLSPPN